MPSYKGKTPEERKAERQAWRQKKEMPVQHRDYTVKNAVSAEIILEKKIKRAVDFKKLPDTEPGELPDDLLDTLSDYIDSFCRLHEIEDMRKASAQTWTACCMRIGWDIIKPKGLLLDKEKCLKINETAYDPEKILNLTDIWAYLCNFYEKPPLKSDFEAFSGISHSYKAEWKKTLTSSGKGINDKLTQIQETGLSSRLVDNKGNPIGTIFFLKNWHGWKDQREVVHTDTRQYVEAADLPVLGEIPQLPGEVE